MPNNQIFTGRIKPCLYCGKGFYCTPCRDVGGTLDEQKFCSNPCYWTYRQSPEGVQARFWALVRKTDTCWLFEGCIGHEGYGSFSYGYGPTRRQFQAHRFSWLTTNGQIPEDKLLLHHCDVRNCVNLESHLYLGTRQDNSDDKMVRGRYRHRYTPLNELLWPQLSIRVKAQNTHFAAGRKE
jgi:hypothetical protein